MSKTIAQLLEEYEPVIGLEVHVQLATHTKIFSGSATQFGSPPNSLVDPVVMGMPGTLPVFNKAVIELALRLGIATGSQIRTKSRFARKHYFYPDQPKGYQISQYDEPLLEHGHLDLLLGGAVKRVNLTRIHLEEDAGKNTHVGAVSHVDLNRAGAPLCEVVSEPEITSAEEAAEFMRSLHRLVRWLGVSEADMEKGHLRCDANVSVKKRGAKELGVRTELKNINSFRFVQNAVDHEIARQLRLIESGERIQRETRLWDAEAGQSYTMRTKEEANDYRYFPDPDLPALVIQGDLMASVVRSMPELPIARFTRYTTAGISPDDARTLIGERALADYFEAAVTAVGDNTKARAVGNWIVNELLGRLNADGKDISSSPMPAAHIGALVKLVEAGTISGKIGKEIFDESYKTGEDPAALVEKKGVTQISDEAQLWEIVDRVVTANAKQAAEFASGKDGLFGFFVGQVMKQTQGRANPVITTELLHKRLGR
ncbi:MAG TPA: Asp-tRNA(Asn)/Glu-tRNA(Gln) amidotransferase subunit GatB [Kofleriaceae bacterium]